MPESLTSYTVSETSVLLVVSLGMQCQRWMFWWSLMQFLVLLWDFLCWVCNESRSQKQAFFMWQHSSELSFDIFKHAIKVEKLRSISAVVREGLNYFQCSESLLTCFLSRNGMLQRFKRMCICNNWWEKHKRKGSRLILKWYTFILNPETRILCSYTILYYEPGC